MPITVKLTTGRTVNFPDGTSQADMEAALRQLPAEAPAPREKTWVDTAVDALPTAGGIAGGLIGGAGGTVAGFGVGGVPGAVGGATLGGGAGEAAKELINRYRGVEGPTSATEAAKNIGGAGAVQGAGELVGAGAAKIAEPIAKGLYASGMVPLKALRAKYGLKKLIDAGFENGIMPTAGGVEKAGVKLGESKATQRGMADAFEQGGGQLPSTVRTVSTSVQPLIKRASAAEQFVGSSPADRLAIVDAGKNVVRRNPGSMSATTMMDAKHAADDIADPAYKAMARTGIAVPNASEAGIAKGFSKGYRNTLNDAIGPEFAAQGQATKTMYGVKRMAEDRAEAPHQLRNLIAGATALGGAGAATGSDTADRVKRGIEFGVFAAPQARAATAFALPAVAQYGPRALDAITGSNVEQYLRNALMQQLAPASNGQ